MASEAATFVESEEEMVVSLPIRGRPRLDSEDVKLNNRRAKRRRWYQRHKEEINFKQKEMMKGPKGDRIREHNRKAAAKRRKNPAWQRWRVTYYDKNRARLLEACRQSCHRFIQHLRQRGLFSSCWHILDAFLNWMNSGVKWINLSTGVWMIFRAATKCIRKAKFHGTGVYFWLLSEFFLKVPKMYCQLLDQIWCHNLATFACNFLHKLLHGIKGSMSMFIAYVT